MSDLDVVQLDRGELAQAAFPVSPSADFRLYFAPKVHQGIFRHAGEDRSVEICGVLVGEWRTDNNGPYAVVENFIRCDSATSKFAEVTFTHESWAQINEEMDTTYADKRIVGWYHSHPDFGIFLSDRDCFIHQHFFSGPGQVAFVVDPVRKLEGSFAWKGGKPTPMTHYWVGDDIQTIQASAEQVRPTTRREDSDVAATRVAAKPVAQSDGISFATLLLSFLALFLLGYYVAGLQKAWERQAIVDGVVSQYTNFRLAKLGLREELDDVQRKLDETARALQAISVSSADSSNEAGKDFNTTRRQLVGGLHLIKGHLQVISDRYSFSDQERAALMRLKRQVEEQLRRPLETEHTERPTKPAEAAPQQDASQTESEPPASPTTGDEASDANDDNAVNGADS